MTLELGNVVISKEARLLLAMSSFRQERELLTECSWELFTTIAIFFINKHLFISYCYELFIDIVCC